MPESTQQTSSSAVGAGGLVAAHPVVAIEILDGRVLVNGEELENQGGQEPHEAAIHHVAREVATTLGRPVRARATDANGTMGLVVHPDGQVSDLEELSTDPGKAGDNDPEPSALDELLDEARLDEPANEQPTPEAPHPAPVEAFEAPPGGWATPGTPETPERPRGWARPLFADDQPVVRPHLNGHDVRRDPSTSETPPVRETSRRRADAITPAAAAPAAPEQAPVDGPGETPAQARTIERAEREQTAEPGESYSFLTRHQAKHVAQTGWRGALTRMGITTTPSEREQAERDDVYAISRHWPGPRTIAIVNGKGGAGKALADDEPVLTPAGYRPIGSLKIGDQVIGSDGLSYPVLGVYPQGERDLYRVTLSDGTSILADGDHIWEVHTANDRGRLAGECTIEDCDRPVCARGLCRTHHHRDRRGTPSDRPIRTGNYARFERTISGGRLMTTADLAGSKLHVDRPGRGARHNYFIPVAAPVKLDPTGLPLDPYLLGLLLGDGSLCANTLSFSTADRELADAAAAALPAGAYLRHKAGYDYRIVRTAASGPNAVTDALRELGLWGHRSETKHVPEVYKLSDLDARTALLQGLMDTDGCATKGVVGSFTSVSARLAEDVAFLAESLGCVVSRYAPRVNYYDHHGERRTGQLAYTLRVRPPAGLELFRLERKQSKMVQGQRRPYRAVVSIEPAERGHATCIAVASPDRLFLTRSCVPTHNTPTTVVLSSLFARHGGSGILAWDNNETRGTLGWRTEQGPHDSHVLTMLPHTDRLMLPTARSADLAAFVHHQTEDKYDVLRSNPEMLASEQRLTAEDFDAVHQVADKYYRLIFCDSGNDETAPHWLRMIDRADQVVVATTTRPDHAEAGRLLLDALRRRDAHSARLAEQAVVVVSQADREEASVEEIASGYAGRARAALTIPYDRALRAPWLRFSALQATTQRAYLRAAAAVSEGL